MVHYSDLPNLSNHVVRLLKGVHQVHGHSQSQLHFTAGKSALFSQLTQVLAKGCCIV